MLKKPTELLTTVCPASSTVAQLFTLNELQTEAFLQISKQLCRGYLARLEARRVFPNIRPITDDGFYMYLGGQAGTGKTQIIKALKYFAKSWDFPDSIVTMAYTGKAALGCLGTTIHSFFFANATILACVFGTYTRSNRQIRAHSNDHH